MTLVFDLDNTLIDRNGAYWLWLENNVLLNIKDINKSLITYYDNWGYTSRSYFYKWLIKEYSLSFTPEALIIKCAQELHNYINEKPEVLRILDILKKDYKIVIGTNGGVKNQMHKLKASGLLDYTNGIYISEAIGFKKPDFNFYKQIQRDMNCNPAELTMVGDHYKQDCLVPKKIGWEAVWLSYNRQMSTNNKISSLKDLIPYLREK